ncbi:MAG: undecaprenyldiphospho-muramoylpentapeptide beta-N-acetylglucosaminyltransferase [Cytophagales bacterium]|nr:undecaprenyldiphospho-muramoylpentapeptide beta-N-acetylglucosaminyltransferase [Cytophagales bacterium]
MSYKFIISGGGTGGHIFPAIAIANTLKHKFADCEILFVGALGKMEMEKVPQNGFKIIGLPIAGIQRKINLQNIIKNIFFPVKLILSLYKAYKIVADFKPHVVIGVGGYASGPTLWAATWLKIPTLIQEQNSYAGITNKILAYNVDKICVAYEGMEEFFPKHKMVLTGNPVRSDIADAPLLKMPAALHFKLDAQKKTILVLGGSLGAKTINDSIAQSLDKILSEQYQLIWQTGKNYFADAQNIVVQKAGHVGNIRVYDFIKEMHFAYGMADVVISRAGALSISELCIAGKACILVPSPNVSEDHQTKNAMALVSKNAALMVKDFEAQHVLADEAISLLHNDTLRSAMKENIYALAKPNATQNIVNEIVNMLK